MNNTMLFLSFKINHDKIENRIEMFMHESVDNAFYIQSTEKKMNKKTYKDFFCYTFKY